MPAHHEINHNSKLIVTTWTGEATDTELIDAFSRYQREIRSQADYYSYDEILDLGKASGFKLSTEGIRTLAHMAVDTDVEGVKTKLAIIVSSSVAYGLGRMYVTYRNLVPGGVKDVRVFKEHRAAEEWIGNNAGS